MDRPAFHATLNATSAVLLTLGWLAIRGHGPWRSGRSRRAHAGLMLSAFGVSTLFLASYLEYHYRVGRVDFWGTGWLRTVYLAVLLPHTILAVLTLPFIIATLVLALRDRLPAHRRLARLVLPAWLFVSVSGVVVWYLNFALRPG